MPRIACPTRSAGSSANCAAAASSRPLQSLRAFKTSAQADCCLSPGFGIGCAIPGQDPAAACDRLSRSVHGARRGSLDWASTTAFVSCMPSATAEKLNIAWEQKASHAHHHAPSFRASRSSLTPITAMGHGRQSRRRRRRAFLQGSSAASWRFVNRSGKPPSPSILPGEGARTGDSRH